MPSFTAHANTLFEILWILINLVETKVLTLNEEAGTVVGKCIFTHASIVKPEVFVTLVALVRVLEAIPAVVYPLFHSAFVFPVFVKKHEGAFTIEVVPKVNEPVIAGGLQQHPPSSQNFCRQTVSDEVHVEALLRGINRFHD